MRDQEFLDMTKRIQAAIVGWEVIKEKYNIQPAKKYPTLYDEDFESDYTDPPTSEDRK